MIEKRELYKDLKKILKQLDITPAMFKNAEDKYMAIATYLKNNGLDIEITLQGSFAIGTGVKPYKEGKDCSYDIDAICLFPGTTDENSSREIRNALLEILNDSEVYESKLDEYDKCFTLDYALYGNYGFSIDLVPSVYATTSDINRIGIGVENQYLGKVTSIAVKNEDRDEWYTSNPNGYKQWFDTINYPFSLHQREIRMMDIYNQHKDLYNNIEDIPEYFNKSALQEVIQILKRTRDISYYKMKKESFKPASVILTTFSALVAAELPASTDTIDLLQEVIKRLKLHLNKEYRNFKDAIIKYNSEWEFYNPVNSSDNLVDLWKENEEFSKCFFEWITRLEKDINEIFSIGSNHISILGNMFGNDIVDITFNRKTVDSFKEGAKPYHD
ncbi:MAG: nucleotidyltransferase [Clostridium sp.]|nr:nucleotidyltransferase [Clostridium sp.]